jgi:hypothetical protein
MNRDSLFKKLSSPLQLSGPQRSNLLPAYLRREDTIRVTAAQNTIMHIAGRIGFLVEHIIHGFHEMHNEISFVAALTPNN